MNIKENDMINERYEIVEKIDNNIFKCDDLQLRRRSKDYKCNNVFFKLNKNDELVETIFLNQINKIKDIRHKNILRVIDGEFIEILNGVKNTEKDLMFIVQEYFKGKSLEKFLLSNKLTMQERLNIVSQLLDGVLYLHSINIVHGNLDTKNIYILKENKEITIKVGNYGLNKLNETFYDKKVMSKKKYLNNNKGYEDIDFKNDIYALSLIITEILGEYNVFLGENIDQLIAKKLDRRYIDIVKSMLYVDDDNKGYIAKDFKQILLSTKPTSKHINESYSLGIRISPEKLYEENYITENNYYEAKCFIAEELKESYITYKKYRKDEFDRNDIIICGRRVKFYCKVDQYDSNKLVAIGFANSFEELEEIKEYALKVDWNWDTSDSGRSNSLLSDLLIKLEDNTQKCLRKIDIMEAWKSILKVERENMYESRKKLNYTSFRYDKKNYELLVNVGDNLEDNPYTGKDDEVLVMTSKEDARKSIKVGRYEDYFEGEIVIYVNSEFDEKLIAQRGSLQVDTSGVNSLIRRKESALRAIEKERSINKNLKNIIKKPHNATSYNRVTLDSMIFKDDRLDESKKENIIKSINSEDIFLLQGPPGTGKTTFINELVCQITSRQKDAKILIASQSHVAVDNALDNISKSLPEASIIRLGEDSKISETMKKKTLDEHASLWINEISEKSILALKRFKKSFSLNDNIKNNIRVIEEIDKLTIEINDIRKDLPSKRIKLQNIERVYESLTEFTHKINEITEDLTIKKSNYTDNYLINKLENFKKDYLSLGNMFISKLESANSVSLDKNNLEEEILFLEIEVEDKESKIEDNKLKLGIKSNNDYEKIKASIKDNKEQFEQYENISKVLYEWKERIDKGPKEIEEESIKHASIIGATCIEVGKKAYDLEFDWVIVDEAGRATPPEIFVPMVLGKKILLVGDDKQLPPVIEKELYTKDELKEMGLSKDDLETSLFAYLSENLPSDCKGMLNMQYRMNPIIGQLVSEVFYKKDLNSGCTFEDKYHRLNINPFKNKSITWLTTRKLENRKETQLGNGNYYNKCELQVIKDYLEKINEEYGTQKVYDKSVGVICGYRKQKEILIANIDISEYSNINLDINTVDAFQGRECDIIFYSVVRSNSNGNIGFLKDVRRLNVALSRAKELLVIVGDDVCATKRNNIQKEKNPFVEVIKYIKSNDKCNIWEV